MLIRNALVQIEMAKSAIASERLRFLDAVSWSLLSFVFFLSAIDKSDSSFGGFAGF